MKRLGLLAALVTSLVVLSPLHAAEDYSATINIFKTSPVVKPYFESAYGYAVFPTIGKGGVGIGGAHGKGQVYRGGKVSGYTSMTQLTIGLQLGGQAFSQIIFFQNKRTYDEFTTGNFEFGAQATAVAITAGATAQAGTDGAGASATAGRGDAGRQESGYSGGTAIFTYVKGGLMYEAALRGQKFNFKPIK